MEGSLKKSTMLIIQVIMILALIAVPALNVYAQENWIIAMNLVSQIESPEFMTLKLYFTISDGPSGTPVTNAQFSTAQVALLNQNYIANATIKKPDIPIYVAILMDSSGSMGASAVDLKNAAKLALNDIPDNSFFSVIQFDESTKVLQDFTQNISAVGYAIDQYKVSNKGTCIYDSAYSTIEAMAQRSDGRRALILFTDGKDEVYNGQKCSQHTFQELMDLAVKSQVPINTIGLSTKEASINVVELQAMASGTGGFSSIASKDDLPSSFSRIMTALKAQWMAEAIVYPKNGSNNAVLTVTLQDGKSLNTAFTIESNTDYPGPASPVSINLAGLMLSAAKQGYEVQLNLTSPDLVNYVKIEVWDSDGGSKVGEYTFNNPTTANVFLIPTGILKQGGSYELRISAISKADNSAFPIARDDQGKTSTQLIHEFKFDPSSAYPKLEILSVLPNRGNLDVNVSITNLPLVGGFDGWLVDPVTNTQVPGSNFSVPPISSANGTISIPMKENRIKNGIYNVVIRTLALDNSVYTTQTIEGITYKAPSIFQRIGTALIAKPIYLIGVVGIILALVAFLMISSARQKSMSGTPVLQGRIGGGKAGKRNQNTPVIPVSDNEPIPYRPVAQPGQPPVMPPPPAQYGTPPAAYPPVPPPQPYVPQPASPNAAAPQSYVPQPVPPQPVVPLQPAAPVPQPSESFVSETIMQRPDETVVVGARVQSHPYLTITNYPIDVGQNGRVMIDQFPYLVGRTEGNLNISDPSISRKHLQITFDPASQSYSLTDLNSSNGTFLNGTRVTSMVPTPIPTGSRIGIGPHVIALFELA
jgi:VWFA-related protein